MPEFEIKRLEDAPEHAVTVANWIETEWRRLPIHEYFEAVAKSKWHRRKSLPQTLVAVKNKVAIGTVSLLRDDMDTRTDLNPWLGCLYVPNDFRKRGIATGLIERALTVAKELGIDLLFLFTVREMNLFSKLGWEKIGEEFYEGENSTLMRKRL